VALKQECAFPENFLHSHRESWNHSAEQVVQMITAICAKTPDKLAETLSLNSVRKLVTVLASTLVEVQVNTSNNIAKLSTRLTDPQVDMKDLPTIEVLNTIPRPYPALVCASEKCSTTENGNKIY